MAIRYSGDLVLHCNHEVLPDPEGRTQVKVRVYREGDHIADCTVGLPLIRRYEDDPEDPACDYDEAAQSAISFLEAGLHDGNEGAEPYDEDSLVEDLYNFGEDGADIVREYEDRWREPPKEEAA